LRTLPKATWEQKRRLNVEYNMIGDDVRKCCWLEKLKKRTKLINLCKSKRAS
jgi:hypothetical protein